MHEKRILRLQVAGNDQGTPLDFSVQGLICAGFSGRSQDAVEAHVKELAVLGHPVPDTTPFFFKLSHYLATDATTITVLDRRTSGEVEFVLLFHADGTYVTCGSDHTHRDMERHYVAGAKQMHPKVLATQAWRLVEVRDHWDRLMLRSWVTENGVKSLYQEGPLAEIMTPDDLLDRAERHYAGVRQEGTVFMSGTLPTKAGLVYADRFDFELEDPLRKRTIRHSYDIAVLS
jgi:hypothetical protein